MTKIEWAEKTWNPITGCTKISDGCKNCYAERMAKRLAGRFGYPEDDPFRVVLHDDRLHQPSEWKKPSRVFVGSMGDLFHAEVYWEWLEIVFKEMQSNPQHTFILLTKRPKTMADFLGDYQTYQNEGRPLDPHIWIGVTAENQEQADERIPILRKIPAAIRFVSVEPMLGPVDLYGQLKTKFMDGLSWVVCGCETGQGARPMQERWARYLFGQCKMAGVPFFLKKLRPGKGDDVRRLDGRIIEQWPSE